MALEALREVGSEGRRANVSSGLYVLDVKLLFTRARALAIVCVCSIVALLALRVFPDSIFAGVAYLNSILSFVLLGFLGLALVSIFKVQVREFFGMPARTKASFLTIGVAALLSLPPIIFVDTEGRSLEISALGLLFILSIGFGEEIFNRGFVFGFLKRHGEYFGLFFSSAIFGLLHLNRYLGGNWDSWKAYSHVLSAAAVGFFICALMMVTKSIWVAVIFHALADWHLGFKSIDDKTSEIAKPSLLDNLLDPVVGVGLYSIFGVLILWVNTGMKLSPRIEAILNRLKIIEQETEAV